MYNLDTSTRSSLYYYIITCIINYELYLVFFDPKILQQFLAADTLELFFMNNIS